MDIVVYVEREHFVFSKIISRKFFQDIFSKSCPTFLEVVHYQCITNSTKYLEICSFTLSPDVVPNF